MIQRMEHNLLNATLKSIMCFKVQLTDAIYWKALKSLKYELT
jgi:hypothetical protein